MLALIVAISHVGPAAYGTAGVVAELQSAWRYPFSAILPMFFALSGFLVAGSLERCRSLKTFIGLRIIRIAPALAVEVTLSALILGPLLTVYSMKHYFMDPEFKRYFMNLVGDIHYNLPGVFTKNPKPLTVNQQLWTIPYELFCYLAMFVLAATGLIRRPIFIVYTVLGTMAIYIAQHFWRLGNFPGGYWKIGALFLIWSFLAGAAIFQFRDRIRWSSTLFVVAVLASVVATLVGGLATYLLPFSLAYVTVWIGLSNPARVWFLRGSDYSYGVYVYHWVVMQALMATVSHQWYVAAFIGIPLSFLFAAFSWHCVEKPAQLLRTPLMAFDSTGNEPKFVRVGTVFVIACTGFVLCYKAYPLLIR